MNVADISTMISTVGFPIFVAVWMLYKTSKDSAAMNESISELKNAITELTTLIKNEGRSGTDGE